MSTFLGLNTALRGVLAQQAALNVTSHNVANAGTDGYTRQRADMVASDPYALPAMNTVFPGMMGTGVTVSGIVRLRDQFIDQNLRLQQARLSNADTTADSLDQLQAIFNEPNGAGLSSLIDKYFTSVQAVATNPQDTGARQAMVQAGSNLATAFNQLSVQITDLQNQSNAQLNQDVTDINGYSQQIAALNQQIKESYAIGLQPNDLLDQRDRLMDQLAKKMDYTYTENTTTHEITISMGATANLVDPTAPGGFNAITRAQLDSAYLAGDYTTGSVFANESLLDGTKATSLPAYLTQLNDLANSIVTGMNAQNALGFDLGGVAGGNLWNPAGITAATMQWTAAAGGIAAASSWAAPGEPGNGNNMTALFDLKTVVQGAPLNATWQGAYSNIITAIGTQASSNAQAQTNQGALVDALTSRRSETSGVSLDEEMTNMLRFQQAYNASARALTAMDEALDTLINRTGRVGL